MLHTCDVNKRARMRQMWPNGGFWGRTRSAPYVKSRKTEYGRRWCALARAIAFWTVGGVQH
jgi:hypothetical protein